MEFDKKDWKKKLKNFFVDNEYKTEDGNLGMIFKTKGNILTTLEFFIKIKDIYISDTENL